MSPALTRTASLQVVQKCSELSQRYGESTGMIKKSLARLYCFTHVDAGNNWCGIEAWFNMKNA
jgi:hypothetical protein